MKVYQSQHFNHNFILWNNKNMSAWYEEENSGNKYDYCLMCLLAKFHNMIFDRRKINISINKNIENAGQYEFDVGRTSEYSCKNW